MPTGCLTERPRRKDSTTLAKNTLKVYTIIAVWAVQPAVQVVPSLAQAHEGVQPSRAAAVLYFEAIIPQKPPFVKNNLLTNGV